MNKSGSFLFVAAAAAVLFTGRDAAASTIAQNVAWTIDRPETEAKLRIVAYGDSIFAGYKGSISDVAVWSAPGVDGDYASNLWRTDVEVIRRTKSGAKAKDIYDNKIVDDALWMQSADTRVVVFEMCGNDALQARSNFFGQGGTCDYSQLDTALANCTTYQEMAMAFINANANPAVQLKMIANLYYPGYDHDDRAADCTDAGSGLHPNEQDVFLRYLAKMNWRACHFAQLYGFRCADDFAEFMGADYDTNADGKKDVRALRYHKGESEEAYVERITVTLRDTIRDANFHLAYRTTTFDYLQSDDTHPTFEGPDVNLGLFGGSARGSSPPRFADDQYVRRRSPIWRRYGHERMGHALAVRNPALP